MTRPTRMLAWIAAAAAAPAVGLAWLASGPPPEPLADLGEVAAAAKAGQYDRAQSLLERRIAADPADDRAHLAMARFATERPDPRPALAIDHLGRIKPGPGRQAASARFLLGKAHYQQGRYDLAEADWSEALRLDPAVPEAGWALLDLFGIEGRIEDGHRLGMALHQVEPDPRDRVCLLFEMARLDVDKVARETTLGRFEGLARADPGNPTLATIVGIAQIRDGQVDRGLGTLRDSLARHPDSAEAWDAWLAGLDEAGRPDALAEEFDRLPGPLAADPRFARHEGLAAQARRDWPRAARAFGRALEHQPSQHLLMPRLSRALRQAGDPAGADRVSERHKIFLADIAAVRAMAPEVLDDAGLGILPRPELYGRLAGLRERMGRPDEARAWHRLILRDRPGDAASLEALERLR